MPLEEGSVRRWLREWREKRERETLSQGLEETMTICEKVAYYRYIVHLSVPEIAEKLRVPKLTVIMCIRKILALDVELLK